jgi:hypothetical protein
VDFLDSLSGKTKPSVMFVIKLVSHFNSYCYFKLFYKKFDLSGSNSFK